MIASFLYQNLPYRVAFGGVTLDRAPAEIEKDGMQARAHVPAGTKDVTPAGDDDTAHRVVAISPWIWTALPSLASPRSALLFAG
jgi:hypothetical protein